MTVKDAGFLVLETLINQFLARDPDVAGELAELHGNCIAFDLTGTGLKLFFIPDQNGKIQVFSHAEETPDCLIQGSPLSLIKTLNDPDGKSIFSGQIRISGNSALAQRFTGILKRIDINWEDELSHLTGDLIAHQIAGKLHSATRWLSRTKTSLVMDTQEYLQEEVRLLPGRFELDDFYQQVDQLRDDHERLAARVERLNKKIQEST